MNPCDECTNPTCKGLGRAACMRYIMWYLLLSGSGPWPTLTLASLKEKEGNKWLCAESGDKKMAMEWHASHESWCNGWSHPSFARRRRRHASRWSLYFCSTHKNHVCITFQCHITPCSTIHLIYKYRNRPFGPTSGHFSPFFLPFLFTTNTVRPRRRRCQVMHYVLLVLVVLLLRKGQIAVQAPITPFCIFR